MNEQIQHFQLYAGPSIPSDEQRKGQQKFFCESYLSVNDRKISFNQTEIHQPQFWPFNDNIGLDTHNCESCRRQERILKNKVINKVQKTDLPKKEASPSFKKQIKQLKQRIQQLQRQVFSLQRNQHSCPSCKNKMPDYYRAKFEENIMQTEDYEINDAGQLRERRRSRDSLEFQQIDFHMPLMQTTEMEEKMWVFLGTMLIAMGSKVMDFDGNINSFKILKNSVDSIRKQVEKCQEAVSMQFFCSKQQLKEQVYIDGMNFDPFYNQTDPVKSQLLLDGVSIQSLEDYQLVYDFKYNFNIKYHSLITLMQYAKQHCCIS